MLSSTWYINRNHFLNSVILLFLSFYLLHLIGMIHTENVIDGLLELETKFSLLFFPLLFFSFPLKNKNQINTELN